MRALELAGVRILIVDDENDLREVIREDFEFYGADVYDAHNGNIGFDVYLRCQPRIVISDIHMPGGDGVEMVRRIRAHSVPSQPYILFMTGFTDVTEDDAVRLGANGMIGKPFTLSALRAFVLANL